MALSAALDRPLRLHVSVSSPVMLGLLWRLQLSKGTMMLEHERAIALDTRVDLVLVVADAAIVLAATVRSCGRRGAGFQVAFRLDALTDGLRAAIDEVVGA